MEDTDPKFLRLPIKRLNLISYEVVGAAFTVHRNIGPGVAENVYTECLVEELRERKLKVETEVKLPVRYKGRPLNKYKKIDILVERSLIVEVKAVDKITPLHKSQVLTYLRLSGLKLGLLINFNTVNVRKGILRVIN